MAINDLYIVSMRSGVPGNEMLQDFAYQVTGAAAPSDAAEVRAAFITQVVTAWVDCIQFETPITKFVTRNLFDNADWEEYTPAAPIMGQRAGQATIIFACIAFKSRKPASNQQPARKRIGYLSEDDTQGTIAQNVLGYYAALDDLAIELGSDLAPASGNFYSPRVIKRVPYTTPGGKPAYRYPTNPGEAVSFPAIDWSYDVFVTSQITRKKNRGM